MLRYTSLFVTILLMTALSILAAGQVPKNVAYRAKAGTSTMREASLENATLKENLSWGFGGKVQRGWSLYWSLISQFLSFDGSVESEAFATSLSRWQQRMQLLDSGILDQETWLKMVEQWQARRSKDHRIPVPEKLVMVTAAEFYDPYCAAPATAQPSSATKSDLILHQQATRRIVAIASKPAQIFRFQLRLQHR